MEKIFIRFTIKGDDLDVGKIHKDIPIDADLFRRGEVLPNKFASKPKKQKTNRWVYSVESQENENLNACLKRMFSTLRPWITVIKEYTKNFAANIDIVVYLNCADPVSKYSFSLSKTNLKMLNKINAKFDLTILDW